MNTLLPPGSGITVTGSALVGSPNCAGTFTQGQQSVSLPSFPDAGIILSSGGPSSLDMQNGDAATTCSGTAGDSDLDIIASPDETEDACVLNIEFTVDSDVTAITFKYVFGSDEYLEYVNSRYNDAFGK